MSNLFVKPITPTKQQNLAVLFGEPFSLPSAGGEIPAMYVTAIKGDAPFNESYFDGVCFEKRTQPPEASNKENEGRSYPDRLLTALLTTVQVKAIREAAKTRYKAIPPRPNIEFGTKNDIIGKEYADAYKAKVSDFLILEKASEFKPHAEEYKMLLNEIKAIQEETEINTVEKDIYASQGKRKK